MLVAVFVAGSIALWCRPIGHVHAEIVLLLVERVSEVVLRKSYWRTRQGDGNGVDRGGDFVIVWSGFELWDGDVAGRAKEERTMLVGWTSSNLPVVFPCRLES